MTYDYSHQNLRGRSFKRQNLREADFSYADIRGTDFTGADLSGANFQGAVIGQQRRYSVLIYFNTWLLALLTAFFSTTYGLSVIMLLIYPVPSNFYSIQIIGWVSFITLIAFFTIAIRKGINSSLAVVSAIMILIAIVMFVNIVLKLTKDSVKTGRIAYEDFALELSLVYLFVAIIIFGAIISAIAGVITLDIGKAFLKTMFIAVSLPFSITVALLNLLLLIIGISNFKGFSSILPLCFIICFIIIGITPLFSAIYIFIRTQIGDKKYTLFRNVASALKKIGATSFRYADLTNANFTKATLDNARFERK